MRSPSRRESGYTRLGEGKGGGHPQSISGIDGLQMSIKHLILTEGKCVVNRQLYSRPFILRETASFLL